MAKNQDTKKISRKETRKIILDKITGALVDYKNELKDKKIAANLKKLSKLLASDKKFAGKHNGKLKASKKKDPVIIEQAAAEKQESVPVS